MTPLLTICVPTYNRRDHTEKLLLILCDRLLSGGKYNVEVVVSDNQSSDGTAKLKETFVGKGVRWITQPTFLPTAEAHMVACSQEPSGKYIWFIGDDDLPHWENFDWLYEILESDRYDYMLVNASLIGLDGNIANPRPIIVQREIIEAPMQAIVEATGITFLFGGVSTHIMRRSLLSKEVGEFYLNAAPIYSQAGWIMDCFKSACCAFINRPLLLYRETDYRDGHWARQADKREVPDMFFWTTGLMQILKTMIARGVLTHHNVARFLECRGDGSRYRLIEDMTFKTHAQLTTFLKEPHNKRQQYQRSHFEELRAFCLTVDGTLYDLWREISDLYNASPSRQGVDKRRNAFETNYYKYNQSNSWLPYWSNSLGSFSIFNLPLCWVAINRLCISNVGDILRDSEPASRGVEVLCAESYKALLEKIQQANVALQEAPVSFSNKKATAPNIANEGIPFFVKIGWVLQHLWRGLVR